MKADGPLGKRVSILGMGVSGVQSAQFLAARGYEVYLSDRMQDPEIKAAGRALGNAGIQWETGRHDWDRIARTDWMIVSPGISPYLEELAAYRALGKGIYSEIEVASWFCPSSKILAVTGTAGKTTATTLITRLLEAAGRRALSCGNIGNPWIGELNRIDEETFVVMELSSFQLFYTERFHPWLGVLLNLSPNHLDWHRTMEHYVAAKLKMFANQGEGDYALLRTQDRRQYFPSADFRSRVMDYEEEGDGPSSLRLLNRMAEILSIPSETVQKVFREFRGIEHRLELVGQFQGISFVNDSKATTPLSLGYALQKYPDQSVILLAGGRAKSRDFGELKGLLSQKVKRAYVFGESMDLIAGAWSEACPVLKVPTIRDALSELRTAAVSGDVVLLSPACASFDQFKNYEERGRHFKELVRIYWPETSPAALR